MSEPAATASESASLRLPLRLRAPLSSWRLIPELDKDPKLLALVQRLPGRIGICACFAIVLSALGADPLIAPLAAACAYAGRYRWQLIPFATLLELYRAGFWLDLSVVARVADQEGVAGRVDRPLLAFVMLAVTVLLSASLIHLWPRLVKRVPALRRSTLSLMAFFFGLVALAQPPLSGGVPRVVLWTFLMAFLPYFWFLAYALADAGDRQAPPLQQRLGLFHPFWGSTLTPFGKGFVYLRKFEAHTPEELAVTQLKGLKLVLWAALLAIAQSASVTLFHRYLGIPSFDDAFARFLAGAPDPWPLCWASLFASFVEDLLNMTVWGGVIIAGARMAGFRLLRNTYKPMASTSLVDFWNRYYFYFKELLVDHFFYPTFLGWFRKHRRLRLFFATFMAACVGNWLFHFMRDIRFVVDLGVWGAAIGDQAHAFYTVVLALGIALSQIWSRSGAPPRGGAAAPFLAPLRVALFFCLLHVFDAPLDRHHTLVERARFLFYLLGLDRWT